MYVYMYIDEQLGSIPRPARCTGGRTAGESLVGGEGGGDGGEEERRGEERWEDS